VGGAPTILMDVELHLRLKLTETKLEIPAQLPGHKQFHSSHQITHFFPENSAYTNLISIIITLHLTQTTDKTHNFLYIFSLTSFFEEMVHT
jgi:hypothetical protein